MISLDETQETMRRIARALSELRAIESDLGERDVPLEVLQAMQWLSRCQARLDEIRVVVQVGI